MTDIKPLWLSEEPDPQEEVTFSLRYPHWNRTVKYEASVDHEGFFEVKITLLKKEVTP